MTDAGFASRRSWWEAAIDLLMPRARLAAVLLALVPAAQIILATRHGLAVSPDSAGYLNAARTFADSGALIYWDGLPFVHWPPGLPVILGLGLRAGIDAEQFALGIDVVAAAAYVLLAYAIAAVVLRSRALALVVAGMVALASTTLRVFTTLLTEPLFLVLSLAVLLVLVRMARDGVRPRTLIALAIFVSAAGTLRYIGFAFLPIVGLSILLIELPRGLRRAFLLATLATMLSAIGSALVLARNLVITGSLTGTFHPSQVTLGDLLNVSLGVFGRWIVPQLDDDTLAIAIGAAVVGLVVAGAVVLLRNPVNRRASIPVVILAAGYLVVLLVSELRVDGYIDYRYLSPLLVPSAILSIGALRSFLTWSWDRLGGREEGRPRPRWSRWPAGALVAALVLAYVGANAVYDARAVLRVRREGSGYNTVAARTSPLAKAVRDLPPGTGVLSNDPVELWWTSGGRTQVSGASLSAAGDAAAALRAQIASGTLTYYAEFKRTQTLQGIMVRSLDAWGVLLESPVPYRDGTLYRMVLGPGA